MGCVGVYHICRYKCVGGSFGCGCEGMCVGGYVGHLDVHVGERGVREGGYVCVRLGWGGMGFVCEGGCVCRSVVGRCGVCV